MSAFHTPSTVAFDNMSWFELLQIFSTLGAAINFGGSALQSPLIMPAMQDEVVPVPVHYTAQSTAYLLHNSEHFFPPLNALCSLTNVILAGTAYYNRDRSPLAAAKFPLLAAAAGLNIATTAWSLGIQVPMNKRMAVLAGALKNGHERGSGKEASHKAVENEFRALQKRWIVRNYGRATIMITAALTGAVALVTRA